jgi:UPF0716 family protein affecting phage T7 exclusion
MAFGVIMLISGLLVLFVVLGFWLGALLLLVAGIVALVRQEASHTSRGTDPDQVLLH